MKLQKDIAPLRTLAMELSNSSTEWKEYFEVKNNYYTLAVLNESLCYCSDATFFNGSCTRIWQKLFNGSKDATLESFQAREGLIFSQTQ